MDWTGVISILLGGGMGVLGFAQFLISRHDAKKAQNSEFNKRFDQIDKRFDDVNKRFDTVDQKIQRVEDKGDERAAVTARVRILSFSDELVDNNKKPSKDSYDQCMSDITTYNHYCRSHPEFKNNQTISTVTFLTADYEKRLATHDFLL